jgi:hypothetical protein
MNNISKEIRGKLKRLCPYVGSNIPNSVREKARDFWPIDGVEQKQAMKPAPRSFNRRAAMIAGQQPSMIAAQQPGCTPSAGEPRGVPD